MSLRSFFSKICNLIPPSTIRHKRLAYSFDDIHLLSNILYNPKVNYTLLTIYVPALNIRKGNLNQIFTTWRKDVN